MLKKLFLFIFFVMLSIAFIGNNSNKGIDRYYFVIALGIDKSDNNLLKVSVQIPSSSSSSPDSSSGGGSSQSSNYKIYSVEAQTIDEALLILNNYLNKEINLSHCSAFVISEQLAKEGIKTFFNTLSNNTELRHSCKLLISSSTAYDVLDKVSESGEAFSSRLFDYLTSSAEYTGFTIDSTFGEFFQALHNDYFQPTAIYTLVSDETIQTSGIAIFKNEYMVGHINPSNTISHSIITNKLNETVITLENPFNTKEAIDLQLGLYKKTDINVSILNGSPFISIKVYPRGTVLSSGSNFNYIDNKNIKELEMYYNSYLEKEIKNYLYDISKKYNSDIIGFKGKCEMKYLTQDEFSKIHWEEIFQDSFFKVEVNSQINSSNLFNKE